MLQLLPVLLFTRSTSAAQCGGSAFALPIQDVLVEPNITDSYEKGIPVMIGTPQQNVVLLPWAELNNTYLYDQNAYCDPTVIFSNTICLVRRGGYYLESDSTSFAQDSSIVAAGGAPQETLNQGAESGIKNLVATSLGGTDDINFGNTGIIHDFPIGIPRQQWDNGYSTLHPLGLGSNSTYLNALYNAGTIASRVWSIYWGRMWTDTNPLNGSLVLGGYDEKKVLGENFTQKLDYSDECFTGLRTTITDIVLNFRAGIDQSLFAPNSAVSACIVPTRQLLYQGPSRLQSDFQIMTNTTTIGDSSGIHWGAMLFDANSKVYDGDITFKLDSGMSVRVPNDQFVTTFVSYDENGSRYFNDTDKEVLIGRVGTQVTTLGRYFLTASYIMVDHDQETWTIWNANPTSSSSLKTIVNNDKTVNCSSSSNGSSSGNSSSSSSNHSLSGAALAGTVIGVILVVGLVGAAAFGFWKRKRRSIGNGVTLKHDQRGPGGLHELNGASTDGANLSGKPYTSNMSLYKYGTPDGMHPAYSNQQYKHELMAPVVYEMPDRNTLPSTPLMSDRN